MIRRIIAVRGDRNSGKTLLAQHLTTHIPNDQKATLDGAEILKYVQGNNPFCLQALTPHTDVIIIDELPVLDNETMNNFLGLFNADKIKVQRKGQEPFYIAPSIVIISSEQFNPFNYEICNPLS